MDLSVIIVNYNTKDLLRSCLSSLIKNAGGIRYEIIVVDNCSSDGSVSMLEGDFPGVRMVLNMKNLGFARANNQGIKIAKGNSVLLLNSDTIILDDCLEKILAFVNSEKSAGIVGCKVLNPDKTLQYTCYKKPCLLSELIFFTKDIIKNIWDPVTYYKYMKHWDHKKTREVDCIAGCFLWIKREVFDKIGLLDENFFMYYEDAEFCFRTKLRSGYKIYYFPFAEIVHLKGASTNSNAYDFLTLKNCYKAAKYYFEKCYGRTAGSLFDISCKFLWRIEISVFALWRSNRKFNEKFNMLKSLCKL